MVEKRISQEQKREIVRQYYRGKSVRQLAKESGRTASTIYRWLREMPPDCGAEPDGGLYPESTGCFTIDTMEGFYEAYGMLMEESRLVRGNLGRLSPIVS